MKKTKRLLCLFFAVILMFAAFAPLTVGAVDEAATVADDGNYITDTSSIENDLSLLGIDIQDYYDLDPYLFKVGDIHLLAIGENYIGDDKIQTYFYFFNPSQSWSAYHLNPSKIDYTINGHSKSFSFDENVVYVKNGLCKVKGFVYDMVSTAKISINQLYCKLTYNGNVMSSSKESEVECDFQATMKHTYKDNVLNTQIKNKTTLIITDMKVVRVNVDEDSGLYDDINELIQGTDYSLDLYFYNFNFPDYIKVDSIEYAKFSYDYKVYQTKKCNSYLCSYCLLEEEYDDLLISSEYKISEYRPSTRKIKCSSSFWNVNNLEFEWPVFYLGDRRHDKQFDLDSDQVVTGDLSSFGMDASILIDVSGHNTQNRKHVNHVTDSNVCLGVETTTYTSLDEVKLIELHYMSEGQLVKANVVSPPVDEEDIVDGGIDLDNKDDEPDLNQYLKWFEELIQKIKDFAKIIVIIFIILAVVTLIITFLPIIKEFFSIILRLFRKNKNE